MSEYIISLDEIESAMCDIGKTIYEAYKWREIVRCRDCQRVTIDQGDHDYREPLWCGLFRMDVSLDGFCKWGERK